MYDRLVMNIGEIAVGTYFCFEVSVYSDEEELSALQELDRIVARIIGSLSKDRSESESTWILASSRLLQLYF